MLLLLLLVQSMTVTCGLRRGARTSARVCASSNARGMRQGLGGCAPAAGRRLSCLFMPVIIGDIDDRR